MAIEKALRPRRQDEVRAQIQAKQIINRLQGHVDGKVELSATQVQAAKILLSKTLPDLSATELSGNVEQPVYVVQVPAKNP